MIIENTQSRMYICAFVNKDEGKVDKLILKPKENFVNSNLLKSLEDHPGFNERVKLGYLKIIDEPKKEKKAKKTKETKEAKGAKKDSKSDEDFLQ